MRKSLVLAVVAVALDVLAPVFGAQAYVVNGQAAARAEVQYLVSYDPRLAGQMRDPSAVTNERVTPSTSVNGDRACWFDAVMPRLK